MVVIKMIPSNVVYSASNASTNKQISGDTYRNAYSHETETNIFFLRMPKTGSATLKHILHKFAWKNILRLAINKNYYGEYPIKNLFPSFRVGITPKFNIMADHGIYKPMLISKILHTPMTNITFIRHPVLWLDSYLRYSKLSNPYHFNLEEPIENFLKVVKSSKSTELHRFTDLFIRYFGINTSIYSQIEEYIRIEEAFFVGITDYYDESIVLLRRTLGWSIKDMIYIPKNVQNYKRLDPIKDLLYNQVCQMMQDQCLLFKRLNKTFWERYNREKNDIAGEVYHFKYTLKNISSFCFKLPFFTQTLRSTTSHRKKHLSKSIHIPASQWHGPFDFTYSDCMFEKVTSFKAFFFYRQNININCSEQVPSICSPDKCRSICKKSKSYKDPVHANINNLLDNA